MLISGMTVVGELTLIDGVLIPHTTAQSLGALSLDIPCVNIGGCILNLLVECWI